MHNPPETTLRSSVPLQSKKHRQRNQETKVNFLSLASHALRTPLSITKWHLDLLLTEKLGKLSSDQRSSIVDAYEANERMIQIVGDLLLVTRIEQKRLILDRHPLRLPDLVRSIVEEEYGTLLKQSKKLIVNECVDDGVWVLADRDKIRKALKHILDNAILYSPPTSRITVVNRVKGKQYFVSVHNTGRGIPKGDQRRLYRRFVRGSEVLKFATEGMGIGLYIAKSIIQAHGGKIWFTSAPGTGTTFTMVLPIL